VVVGRALPLLGELRLAVQQDDARRGQTRTADEHEVRRAPERDVLAEEPVPDVVEREADEGVEAAGRDEDAGHRRVPAAGDPHRRDAGLLAVAREHDRAHAGDEEGEQAVEDQVVRGVRERSLVATSPGVQADVPEEAEEGHDERAGDEQGRDRRPAGLTGARVQRVAETLEPLDAVGAVGPGDVDEDRGDDGGADAEAEHLVEGGPADRGGLGGAEGCGEHSGSMSAAM
jgi:hypothetical protein